jgi:nitrous oxidase accessory protein NosD
LGRRGPLEKEATAVFFRGNAKCSNIVRATFVVFGILLFAAVAVSFHARPTAAATCGSLQAKVDAAPSGGTVDLPDGCVYRQQVTITKPLTLQGGAGVEIRGSDAWAGWTLSGGYWKSDRILPSFPQTDSPVECMPNTSRCKWPEQVYFGGKASADNVTIQGFTMKHAANQAQSGAIMNRPSRFEDGGSNWTVQNSRLSDSHGAILSFKNATGYKVLNNDIFQAGQLGIHSTADGGLVRGNKVHHNNTEDFSYRWEAGGMKFIHANDTVVDSNEVYNNKGNAIHFDIDCYDNTVSNNRVHHNARKGIQYELSFGGKIFSNVLWENGWATPSSNDGAGITLHNSSTTEVYNNTLAWHPDGIAVFAVDRAEGTKYDRVHDVYVHDNTVLGKNDASEAKNHVALAWLAWQFNLLYDPANNNRGANNRYWYASPEGTLPRFVWKQTNYSRLSAFNLTSGEESGRYLTQSEKDALVASKGIPANPLPR